MVASWFCKMYLLYGVGVKAGSELVLMLEKGSGLAARLVKG